jgi:hypothetical protein
MSSYIRGIERHLDGLVLARLTVVVGLFVLAASLGPSLLLLPHKFLLAGVVGTIFALVALHHMEWGLVALVVASVAVPFSIGTGTQSAINTAMLLTAALTALWVTRMLVVERQLLLVPSAANLPLLAFVFVAGLSIIAGRAFWDLDVPLPGNAWWVQLGGFAVIALSAAAFLLMANCVHEIRWLNVIVGLIILMGVLAVINARTFQPYLFPGVGGVYWMWAPTLAYAQMLYNRHLTRWQWVLLGLSVALWLHWSWFSVLTFVAGWSPLFAAMFVISWFRSKRLALLLLLLLLVWVGLNWDFYYQRLYLFEKAGGSLERFNIWWRTLELFGDRQPLLGLGPASYTWYVRTYRNVQVEQSHNNYIDIFLQTGVVGLGLFLLIFAQLFRQALALRHRFHGDFAQAYVYGVLGGMAGALTAAVFADWVLPYVYNIGLAGFRHSVFTWLLMGGLVSLSQIARSGEVGNIALGSRGEHGAA